jgi:hypothetical protein
MRAQVGGQTGPLKFIQQLFSRGNEMVESITIARRVRSIVSAGLVISVALACTAVVARAAEPIATVGPTTSPTGGQTALGTVSSGGQTDVCLDQQHSGANPGTTSSTNVIQLADRSCTVAAGSPTTAGGSSGSGSGGGTQSNATAPANSSTQTSSSKPSPSSGSATTSRRSAGFSTTSSAIASVSAANARGLRITHVRYKLVNAKAGKRLRVVVTLRDRKHHPVRAAIVSLNRLAGAKSTLPGLRLGLSNRKGQATFVVQLKKSMFGHRVLLRIGARTPSARVLKVGSVLVPKPRKVVRQIAAG